MNPDVVDVVPPVGQTQWVRHGESDKVQYALYQAQPLGLDMLRVRESQKYLQ